jgi:hypothetical protein
MPPEARTRRDAPVLWGFLFAYLLIPSCAFVDYVPPDQGTSAEWQSILAKSLEGSIKEMPFDPGGKVVDLQVRSFGPYRNSSGLERYVRSLFHEWIVSQGGRVGSGQFSLEVFLPVFGNTATSRDLSYQYIPFYYSERLRAAARLIVVIRDAEGVVVRLWQGKQDGADLTDIYLMRIFGPFDVPLPVR